MIRNELATDRIDVEIVDPVFSPIGVYEIAEAGVGTLPRSPEIERHLAVPRISFDGELEVAVEDLATHQGLDQLGAFMGVVGRKGRALNAAVTPPPGEGAERNRQAIISSDDTVMGGGNDVIGTA